MSNICVIGFGFVGRNQYDLLKPYHHMTIWDPQMGFNTISYIENCDLAIICVPTPSLADGSCDISIVDATINQICSYNSKCLILIRSTIPPGSTSALSQKYNISSRLHFSPEFIVERTGIDNKDRFIVGGDKPKEIYTFFKSALPNTKFVECSNTEAEMTKYMTNAFLAVKVAFTTEMYDISNTLDLDFERLRELWLLDDRIGESHTIVFPNNRGFGGKCLPKDTMAITKLAIDNGLEPAVLSGALKYKQD